MLKKNMKGDCRLKKETRDFKNHHNGEDSEQKVLEWVSHPSGALDRAT